MMSVWAREWQQGWRGADKFRDESVHRQVISVCGDVINLGMVM